MQKQVRSSLVSVSDFFVPSRNAGEGVLCDETNAAACETRLSSSCTL